MLGHRATDGDDPWFSEWLAGCEDDRAGGESCARCPHYPTPTWRRSSRWNLLKLNRPLKFGIARHLVSRMPCGEARDQSRHIHLASYPTSQINTRASAAFHRVQSPQWIRTDDPGLLHRLADHYTSGAGLKKYMHCIYRSRARHRRHEKPSLDARWHIHRRNPPCSSRPIASEADNPSIHREGP